MQKVFTVKGMTCQGCRSHVEDALQQLNNIKDAQVTLEDEKAKIDFNQMLSLQTLQDAIGKKYSISELNPVEEKHSKENHTKVENERETQEETSKIKQLQPLFLIFFYIISTSVLLNWSEFSVSGWMFDFMGIFFIVFSFFKFLDYKNFPDSFKMYDPLAKKLPFYAWIYPFLETLLGICFLFRFQLDYTLVATLVILGITTFGVTQSLFSKRKIKCACLGTALNLPMTEATFIENTIMIGMSIAMLIY